MKYALLVMSDGRGFINESLPNVLANLCRPPSLVLIHDDSGDARVRADLSLDFPHAYILGHGPRLGFGGAYRRAWAALTALRGFDWIFSTEDDFVLNRSVCLHKMADVLLAKPHLAQMALRRQAWGGEVFGTVEDHLDDFTQHEVTYDDIEWLESRRCLTTNPSLFRRQLVDMGWYDGPESEGRMGIRMREEGLPWGVPGPDVQFGMWGGIVTGANWVHHIGQTRAGHGY